MSDLFMKVKYTVASRPSWRWYASARPLEPPDLRPRGGLDRRSGPGSEHSANVLIRPIQADAGRFGSASSQALLRVVK